MARLRRQASRATPRSAGLDQGEYADLTHQTRRIPEFEPTEAGKNIAGDQDDDDQPRHRYRPRFGRWRDRVRCGISQQGDIGVSRRRHRGRQEAQLNDGRSCRTRLLVLKSFSKSNPLNTIRGSCRRRGRGRRSSPAASRNRAIIEIARAAVISGNALLKRIDRASPEDVVLECGERTGGAWQHDNGRSRLRRSPRWPSARARSALRRMARRSTPRMQRLLRGTMNGASPDDRRATVNGGLRALGLLKSRPSKSSIRQPKRKSGDCPEQRAGDASTPPQAARLKFRRSANRGCRRSARSRSNSSDH